MLRLSRSRSTFAKHHRCLSLKLSPASAFYQYRTHPPPSRSDLQSVVQATQPYATLMFILYLTNTVAKIVRGQHIVLIFSSLSTTGVGSLPPFRELPSASGSSYSWNPSHRSTPSFHPCRPCDTLFFKNFLLLFLALKKGHQLDHQFPELSLGIRKRSNHQGYWSCCGLEYG